MNYSTKASTNFSLGLLSSKRKGRIFIRERLKGNKSRRYYNLLESDINLIFMIRRILNCLFQVVVRWIKGGNIKRVAQTLSGIVDTLKCRSLPPSKQPENFFSQQRREKFLRDEMDSVELLSLTERRAYAIKSHSGLTQATLIIYYFPARRRRRLQKCSRRNEILCSLPLWKDSSFPFISAQAAGDLRFVNFISIMH